MSLISQAAKRLKTLLATTAGAAQVGFDAAVNYAAGTVGAMLKSLSASITNVQNQIAGILDGATFTGPVVLPGNAAQNLEAVPLQQAMQIAADAAGLAATGVEVGRLLRVERFTSQGTFNKQVGDRLIECMVVGGGGGGNIGGGGAGGTVFDMFSASDLPASVTVFVGEGGNPGYDGIYSGFYTCSAEPGKSGGTGGGGNGGGGYAGTAIGRVVHGGSGSMGIPSGELNTAGKTLYGAGGNSTLGGGAGAELTSGSAPVKHAGVNSGGGGVGAGKGAAGYVEIRVYS